MFIEKLFSATLQFEQNKLTMIPGDTWLFSKKAMLRKNLKTLATLIKTYGVDQNNISLEFSGRMLNITLADLNAVHLHWINSRFDDYGCYFASNHFVY